MDGRRSMDVNWKKVAVFAGAVVLAIAILVFVPWVVG